MKSVPMARYMKNKVPGIDVPDRNYQAAPGVPKDRVAAEGVTMAVEQIQELKECPGVPGPALWRSMGGKGARDRGACGPLSAPEGRLVGNRLEPVAVITSLD